MLFIGIDGGGTRCRVRICNAQGTILGEAQSGCANLLVGVEDAAANIVAALEEALAKAGGYGMDECRVGLGLTGANLPELTSRFRALPLPFVVAALESDAMIACRGAHGARDGAIAILGTGTAYLAKVGERIHSFAGWGFHLSDAGSGADLGREALKASLLAFDGLGPASPLTEDLLTRFEENPARIAAYGAAAKPRDYATLAPLVVDRADEGDPVAVAIMERATDAVETAIRRTIKAGAARLCLMGGLAPRYRPRLAADIRAALVEPEGDALDGALQAAGLPTPASRSAEALP